VLALAATLAGLVLASLAGLNPAWAAGAGAVVLAGWALGRGSDTAAGLLGAASLPFLLFVLGLGVVVEAVVRNGLGSAIARVTPGGSTLLALLALAGLAAALAEFTRLGLLTVPAGLVLATLALWAALHV
jgi:arsenical pump membrane protein